MKRIISMLLALTILCTPALAVKIPDVPDNLFDDTQVKQKIQQVIQDMSKFTEETRNMTDEELDAKIRETADKYHIPPMNQEQIDFLRSICRGLEYAKDFSDSVDGYGEKISAFGQFLKQIGNAFGDILQAIANAWDYVSDLFGQFTQAEPA